MADISEVTPLQGFIAFISSGTTAAGSTATNQNGSINGIGTVVGVAQTGQGLVALGTSGQALTSVPLVGGGLNIAGAGVSAQSMLESYNHNQPIQTSDLSNLISNVASLGANVAGYLVIAAEGSAAAAIASPLIIPLTVVSVAAGTVALVASGMGWTLGSNGQPTQVSLNAQQASQAESMVRQANADPSNIQQALANVDVDISTNSGSFLVPQFDSNGNQIGSAFLTPTTTELINGGTEYEFANGVTLTEYPDASASVAGVSNFNAVWSYPVQNETVTATEIGVNTATGDSASAGSISAATQTVTDSSMGVTTTTTTSISGGQSSMSVTTSQTVDGVSTDITTVSNNGQTLFTEDKTSSEGILISDTISENVEQSLALNGNDVVLNGVIGGITSLIGANNTINLAYGFTGVIETSAAQINVDGNSTVTVSGSGNSVSSPLSGNAFTLDGTGDQLNASGSVIQVASNTLTDGILGNQNVITDVTGTGTVGVSGTGNTVNVDQTGGNVTIGGNGQSATDANVNYVNFVDGASGTVNVENNADVTATGSGLTINGSGNDSIGVVASGSTINLSGASDNVWVGGNGQSNDNTSLDTVNFAAGATGGVQMGDDASAQVNGNDILVDAGTNENLDINGTGSAVNASGNNDDISLSGANEGAIVSGQSDAVDVGGAGSSVTIGGNGQSASDANVNYVNFVNGASGTVNVENNSDVTATGSGLTINGDGNDSIGVVAAGSSVYLSGTNNDVWVGGNSQSNDGTSLDTVTFTDGATGAVQMGDDASAQVYGSDILVDAGTDENLSVEGTGNAVNTSGDNDNILLTGANGTVQVSGQNDSISASTDTINGEDNDSIMIYGSNDTINNGVDSATGIVGSGDTLTSVGDGSAVSIIGQNDSISGSDLTIYGTDNDSFQVLGAGNTITDGLNSTTNIFGDGNTLSDIGGGSAVNVFGTNDAITGSDITVYGENNDSFSVSGSGNTITDGSGSTTNVFGDSNDLSYVGSGSAVSVFGTNETITGSGITVSGQDSDSFSLWGSGNTITDGSGSTTNIFGDGNDLSSVGGSSVVNVFGTNDAVTGSGITVYGENGDSFSLWGSGDIVTNGKSSTTNIFGNDNNLSGIDVGSAVNLLGTNDAVTGSDITISGADNDSFSIFGDDDTITDGNGSATYIYGSNNVLSYAGTGSVVGVNGQDDNIDASGDTIDFTGSSAGDIVDGSGDSGTGWSGVDYIDGGGDGGDNGGDGGYSGGYGYFGGYGFSGDRDAVTSKLAGDVAAIAQFDQAQSNTLASAAAQQGLAQAAEMSQDAQTTAGAGPNVLEGARWDVPTITWSFGDANGPQGTQYESEIEQAFATWAAASGLQFQEVSAGSAADISINWADLNTATTGEVGYTTFKASQGVIAAGASIELESPSQDAFAADADGNSIYAGTDATFYQTVLHEIGHALGLADNADSASIMNYDLTSSDQTLDQTDINAIQALYGSSAQTAALIQAMSGGAASMAGSTSVPIEQASMQTQLLAGAH